MTDDVIVHKAPWPELVRHSRCRPGSPLARTRRATEQVRVEPPFVWGLESRWELTEDGAGCISGTANPRAAPVTISSARYLARYSSANPR